MKTVLLVTADDELRSRLLRPLGDRSVFFAETDDAAVKTLRLAEVDLIIKDATGPGRELSHFAARARELSPSAVIVGISDDATVSDYTDYALLRPFAHRDLATVLRQAEERHRLLNELAVLRSQVTPRVVAADERAGGADMPAPVLEQALKEFAKALAVGFDLPRMLELFLDAVGEIVRPSRLALLLADATGRAFVIRTQRGLAPQLVESVRLAADSGLPQWLATQGRLLQVEEARQRGTDPRTPGLARELGLLQAVLAVPLLARGELVAILTLGERIVGGTYGRRETEMLFTLASQFGAAIRDLRLHFQLEKEKEYNEQILAHMSNGVITIGRDEKISTMNRRAQDILELSVRDAVGHDLRVLPSPLGDLLFETLTRQRTVRRTEVQLALRNLPLEVSTYPLLGDEAHPIGAVLVFEDLSAQKALAAEKRQADQFQLLTRVVARIADEIKNPLVSVNMLMELLEERYDDPEFRRHFSTVVRRDVRRVMQVFEKLTALVNEGDLTFEAVDVRVAVDEMLTGLGAAPAAADTPGAMLLELVDQVSGKRLLLSLYHEPNPQLVKADRTQLKKAMSYLVWFVLHKSTGEQARLSISIGRGEEEVQVLMASRTAQVGPEELLRLFDPMRMVQESLIAVGPAVSQRIVESLGGRLQVRQARHELSFLITLPVTRA
jgi:nitrogen-specific signal transduction histidine kinase